MAKILVVEDNADAGEALCKFLRMRGHEANCAPNGRSALSLILGATPDLIVLDLLMPEMDGASLLAVLRSYLRLQTLPVVVWTGAPDSLQMDQARTWGINTILIKGATTYEQVVDTVERELAAGGADPPRN